MNLRIGALFLRRGVRQYPRRGHRRTQSCCSTAWQMRSSS